MHNNLGRRAEMIMTILQMRKHTQEILSHLVKDRACWVANSDPKADLNPSSKFFPPSHLPLKKVVSLDTTDVGTNSMREEMCQPSMEHPSLWRIQSPPGLESITPPQARAWSWEVLEVFGQKTSAQKGSAHISADTWQLPQGHPKLPTVSTDLQ